uniref:Uncharacterized protein n=1 Tax=Glossina austeni TaxID=7395 RepID=A0A1A9UNC1_GLOAU
MSLIKNTYTNILRKISNWYLKALSTSPQYLFRAVNTRVTTALMHTNGMGLNCIKKHVMSCMQEEDEEEEDEGKLLGGPILCYLMLTTYLLLFDKNSEKIRSLESHPCSIISRMPYHLHWRRLVFSIERAIKFSVNSELFLTKSYNLTKLLGYANVHHN